MSAFLALRDAAVAALLVAPAVASGFVRAGRAVPLPAERPPAAYLKLHTFEQALAVGKAVVELVPRVHEWLGIAARGGSISEVRWGPLHPTTFPACMRMRAFIHAHLSPAAPDTHCDALVVLLRLAP